MELWDIFDRERKFQDRTAVRGSLISKDDFHLIIHAWVRRKSDGKLLISRRLQEIFWGGYWQPTGGSAKAEETSRAAAIRELKEELGVKADDAQSTLLFSYRFVPPEKDNPSFFLDSWLFEFDDFSKNIDLKVVLQKDEVSDSKWTTLEEIIDLWQQGLFMPFEQTWPPYFQILQRTLQKPGTIFSLKAWGVAELKNSKSTTPELDTSLLLSHLLGCSKDALLINASDKVSEEEILNFAKLLYKRSDGLPLAYITGYKDFWKSSFKVSPSVLIPKPDTELLVELASKLIAEYFLSNADSNLNMADICTGSGCIGISVFQEALDLNLNTKKIKLVCTDISEEALKIARHNSKEILGKHSDHFIFLQGDLLDPVLTAAKMKKCPAHFDIIMSNPPYVPSSITDELLSDGRNEPRLALDGGKDGLDIIRRLIPEVWQALNKNGILLIETGEYNAAQTALLLKDAGFTEIKTFKDLGGQPRVTQARKL